jgi:hypothetical protein
MGPGFLVVLFGIISSIINVIFGDGFSPTGFMIPCFNCCDIHPKNMELAVQHVNYCKLNIPYLIDACDVDYHYLSFSILSYDSHRYQIVILMATTPKYSATFIYIYSTTPIV